MKNYRIIKSGNNERREYFSLNRSPLFQNLPLSDTSEDQKKSYYYFINTSLSKLLNFYFPVEFNDHNNLIKLNINNLKIKEPEITEEEAAKQLVTWSYSILLNWKADWECFSIQIPLKEFNDIESNIRNWIEESFKIGTFEITTKSDNIIVALEKKGTIKITIEIKEKHNDYILVSFRYQQTKEIIFCKLPKINERGNFIINGHYKIVVLQTVRAPSVYHFINQKNKNYGEIIPFKGTWINFTLNEVTNLIELKFLNSKKIINLWDILKSYNVPLDIIKIFFKESIYKNYENYEPVIDINSIPKFIFTKKNSYFEFGKLGRLRLNKKMIILNRLKNQCLAEDILDDKNKIILEKYSILDSKNIEKLFNCIKSNSKYLINLEEYTEKKLYAIKIFNKDKNFSVDTNNDNREIETIIGSLEDISTNDSFFDISDLLFSVYYLFLLEKMPEICIKEKEEEKDQLNNQIVRRIGDILKNIFDSRLGGFLYQDISKKYLANISQLKKTDLSKIPNLRDFDSLLKVFFNTSPLVQLQNQNNPLSEIAYTKKVSILGLGGFSADNTTLASRNVNESHYGRFGLMATQEGKSFGLIHNLTINSTIDELGQINVFYYKVKKGIVIDELIKLNYDQEYSLKISHCNIKIDESNKILDENVWVRHQGAFSYVNRKEVDLIDSSFFHLTSVEEAIGPFTPYDDATRKLMTSNMQRSAISPIRNQEPLIATGIEQTLNKNTILSVISKTDGKVTYSDAKKIIILDKTNEKEIVYNISQFSITNKNITNMSFPLVRVGQEVKKGDIIANGHYSKNGELALGYNLRVAYLSSYNNYEDAIIVSDKLIKNEIFTYLYTKEYIISRFDTELGPELFSTQNIGADMNMDEEEEKTSEQLALEQKKKRLFSKLDENGIIKVGSEVTEQDILVRKIVPKTNLKETEEELLLYKILGNKRQKYQDYSLVVPKGVRGIVSNVEFLPLQKKDELERIKIYIVEERKLEDGDKLTTRYGNKGIIKVIPEVDMPYDEYGSFDVIFNPLGVPTRMNLGQLLEAILAEAAFRLNIKLLSRPFNTFTLENIEDIAKECSISDLCNKTIYDGKTGESFKQKVFTGRIYTMLLNHKSSDKIHARNTGPYSLIYQQPLKGKKRDGGQRVGEMEGWCFEAHGTSKILTRLFSSDDIHKRREIRNYLFYDSERINMLYNRNESFNLVLNYLRGMGFNLEAKNFQDRLIDFYKFFSK